MADARAPLASSSNPGVRNVTKAARNACIKLGAGALLVAICAGALSYAVAPECDVVKRYTENDCPCQKDWYEYSSSLALNNCEDYCCSFLDDGRDGEWCQVEWSFGCQDDWGYCQPASASTKTSRLRHALKDAERFWLSPETLIIFAIVFSCSYLRLCCQPASSAKCATIIWTTVSLVFNLAMYFLDWVFYLATDCHDEFRGLSDLLLVLVFVCNFFVTIFILASVQLSMRTASNEELVQSVAQHRARQDPNVMVLQVSETRMRMFLNAEEVRENQVTVTRTGSGATCLQCYTWFSIIFLLGVMILVLVTFYESRAACFWCVFMGLFLSLILLAKEMQARPRHCGCRESCKKKAFERARAKLNGPQELVLFYNPATAAAQPAPAHAHMSGAFSGAREVLIAPNSDRPPVPGQPKTITQTDLLAEGEEGGPGLQFTVTVEVQNPGLAPVQTTVRSLKRLPLEVDQVAQVRVWLEQRTDVFIPTRRNVELA